MQACDKLKEIVSFRSDSTRAYANVYEEHINEIFQQLGPHANSVLVVNVTGLMRKGKSFLINLMICFLEYLEKVILCMQKCDYSILNNMVFDVAGCHTSSGGLAIKHL